MFVQSDLRSLLCIIEFIKIFLSVWVTSCLPEEVFSQRMLHLTFEYLTEFFSGIAVRNTCVLDCVIQAQVEFAMNHSLFFTFAKVGVLLDSGTSTLERYRSFHSLLPYTSKSFPVSPLVKLSEVSSQSASLASSLSTSVLFPLYIFCNLDSVCRFDELELSFCLS